MRKMTPIEKRESYQTELSDILNTFVISIERKTLNEHNLMWMKKNLGILNAEKPKFHRSIALIYLLLIEYENI